MTSRFHAPGDTQDFEDQEPLEGEVISPLSPSGLQAPRVFSSKDVDEEVFQEVLIRMANGEVLSAFAKDAHMPSYWVFMRWAHSSPEREERYLEARKFQASYFADESVTIYETDRDNFRANNKAIARRWLASKFDPRFGANVNAEINAVVTVKEKLDLSALDSVARDKLKAVLIQQLRASGYDPEKDDR